MSSDEYEFDVPLSKLRHTNGNVKPSKEAVKSDHAIISNSRKVKMKHKSMHDRNHTRSHSRVKVKKEESDDDDFGPNKMIKKKQAIKQEKSRGRIGEKLKTQNTEKRKLVKHEGHNDDFEQKRKKEKKID